MLIHLAADHRGHARGRALAEALAGREHDVEWHGAGSYDDGDDYPGFVIAATQAVVRDEDSGTSSRGIIAASDGAGEVVASNKVNGGRATLGVSVEQIRIARARADVNVMVLPGDSLDLQQSLQLVQAFLEAPFSSELDDARRLLQVAEYESAGAIEGWQLA